MIAIPHNNVGKPDRLCRFFLKGRCTYGARCHFLHQAYVPPPLPENHTAGVDREASSDFNNQIEQDALAKARASYMPPPPPEIEQDALAKSRASYMPPPPPETEQDALAKERASYMPQPPRPEIEQDALAKARASYMPPPPPEIEQNALAKSRASYMPQPPPPEIEQDALAKARASYMPPPPPQIEQDALAKARASYMPPPPPEIEQDALAKARASYMPPPPPESEQDALAKARASYMPPPPPETEQDALAKARASYMPPPPPENHIPPFDLTLLGISHSCSSSAHDQKQYISITPVYPTVREFRPAWQRSALRWGDRAEQQKQNSFSTYPVLKLLRKPTTEEEDTPWEIDEDGKRYMYFVPIAPDALPPATYLY